MRASSPLAACLIIAALVLVGAGRPAQAAGEALLVLEADSGKVLKAENATYPWYPASVTKLMTAYVTLRAVKEGRITFDTLFTVSPNAVAQQPTKMGFPTGTTVTVDNALKMMLVRSANDIAVVLAEGVGGSIEGFADEMNAASQRLGMTQSHWVNPNGLPADDQVTSARDMAILARALLREFPEYDGYFNIAAIRFGRRIIRNTNSLIVRYPGADGMKTGFICASGFNVVATATRDNRRLIAVVMGAPSSEVRAAKAAFLFENAFNNTGLSWLVPAQGSVESLPPIDAAPPNLREEMCGKHRRRPAAEDADEEVAGAPSAGSGEPGSVQALLFGSPKGAGVKPSALLTGVAAAAPIDVYTGPTRKPGAVAATSTGRPVVAARPDPSTAVIDATTRPAKPKNLLAVPGRAPNGAATAPLKPAAHRPAAKPATATTAAKPATGTGQTAATGTAAGAAKPATATAAKPAAQPAPAPKPKPPVVTAKPAGSTPAQ